MSEMPPTPECDKKAAVQEDSQTIGEFLEWAEDNGYALVRGFFHDNGPQHGTPARINDVLAEYFEIDLKKVDEEQQAVIEWYRERDN